MIIRSCFLHYYHFVILAASVNVIHLYFSVQLSDKPFNIFFAENSQNYSAIAFNHIEHTVLVHSEPVII